MTSTARSVWPLALRTETSIRRLAPLDCAPGGPLTGVEVQVLTAPDGAETTRVIVQHPDRTVDFFWPADHPLSPAEAALGAGIAYDGPADFARAELEIGDAGLHIHVDLTDRFGRRLLLDVDSDRPWSGYDFAAPPAFGMDAPTSWFQPFLTGFDILSTREVHFSGTYGGEVFEPKLLPVPYRGGRLTMVKACTGIVSINLLADGDPPVAVSGSPVVPGVPETSPPGSGPAMAGGPDRIALPDLDADGNLIRLVAGTDALPVVLTLYPPLPPAGAIRDAVRHRWELTANGILLAGGPLNLRPAPGSRSGAAGGAGAGGVVEMALDADRAWRGVRGAGTSLAARLITSLVPAFSWARGYHWRGGLLRGPGGDAFLEGTWTNDAAKSRR
ncbi:MAG TPA: hypothetical protein VFC82_06545 [Actinomycetaceae bacterium]|nr:hypothetical protein [Actinomycetaceae bacterium]